MNSIQIQANCCCWKMLFGAIFTIIMLSLNACRKDSVSEIHNVLAKSDERFKNKEEDEALALLFELENKLNEATPDSLRYKVLSRIGGVYYAGFKKDKADEYFKRALIVARKLDNGYLSQALWNRCLTVSDNDSIFTFLKECRAISQECGAKYTEAMSGINLASAYTQSGNLDGAREILESMDEIIGNDSVLIVELSNAQLSYLIADKNFNEAKEILDNQNINELSLYGKASRYQNLYAIEIENNRFEKALEYRDSIDVIKNKIDSISFDERLSTIESEFSSKFDKEKKDREITTIISLCIIILLSALLFGEIKRRLMMKKQIELNEQITKLNLKIARLTESHNENNTPADEINADIQSEVIEKLRLNKELFVSQPIYNRLKQLNLKRDSDSVDRTAAKEVLDGVIGQFADVCSNLRQLYVGMTYDDVLYCAAIYVGFSKELASVAFGSSEDALRRRKSRIKQKLPSTIFDAIFGTKV